MDNTDNHQFRGAKMALFMGEDLAVILRDDLAGLPWAGHWDFPGGEREPGETPQDCVLRETREELGLQLSAQDLCWARCYGDSGARSWFFVARMPVQLAQQVVFGDEGQGWALMSPAAYTAHQMAIPHFVHRLTDYLQERISQKGPPPE